MTYRNPVCRGAWALGTACGRCERCIATKPTTNPETAGVEHADAELLRLIAKDHQRLAPNSYHTAECLREIAARIEAHPPAVETAGVEPVAREYEALIAAGIEDYAARCALRTDDDGGFCHAYFYSDGQWRFQTGGNDLHREDGSVLRCLLTKRLYARPAPASNTTSVGEVDEDALESYAKFDGVGPHAETIRTRASIGESYLECYYSALDDPLLKGWTPADCPSELVFHLLELAAIRSGSV